MKKLTKKQMVATGAIAILAIGGVSVGVINHSNTVHAQQLAKTKAHEAKVKADKKAKAEQLAKEKEAAQQKQVAALLATATKNPSDTSIKAVNDAIAKLTDQKEKTKDADLVKGLNNRLALIKKAQAAVKDYQAHATDDNKQKAAQAAINNLKDKNDQDVRAELQKLFDASNKQAQDSAKAAQAQQAASKAAEQPASNNDTQSDVGQSNQEVSQNQATNQQSSNTYQAPATNTQTPSYGGGNTSSNTGGASSNQSNSTNTGGNTNSGGTTPSHPGGYGSIEDNNQAENNAGSAGTGNAINKKPGDKW
ncbi:hypothetical protein LL14B4_12920 (plasmid) [Lactococcus lactis subsp. lactis]|uniref:Uncharacterized protein n=1 Tax=Lactococcus lactis subsp. lactis TaxID=1360 RepID=A0A2Z3KHH2_LACLL|nr:hypothetical protein [Lactococcus lactis]AWN67102.1 hypothetical protein LL14B4_12920 [Lactococcus lactis subsp. lactis]